MLGNNLQCRAINHRNNADDYGWRAMGIITVFMQISPLLRLYNLEEYSNGGDMRWVSPWWHR